MKLRVIDRILIALSGLLLLALACWVGLDAAGVVTPVSETLSDLLRGQTLLVVAGVCVVMALLGIYNVCVLFRRRRGKRGFITQRAENGEIAISVKSIESLVIKCAKKHGEIQVQSVAVDEVRDGLIIRMRTILPNGMNIPLAVGTLQKQVKQYVTDCSGVDVKEVPVKVESTDKPLEASAFAVSEDVSALPVQQPEPGPVPEAATTPVAIPVHAIEETPQEAETQLLHQRLFSVPEEPAYVPEPPAMEVPEAPAGEEVDAEAKEAAKAMAGVPQWVSDYEKDEEAASEWGKAAEGAEETETRWKEAAEETKEAESEWDEPTEETEGSDSAWDQPAEEAEETDPEWGESTVESEETEPEWEKPVEEIEETESEQEELVEETEEADPAGEESVEETEAAAPDGGTPAAEAEEPETEWEAAADEAEEHAAEWDEASDRAEESEAMWGRHEAAADAYASTWESIADRIDQEEARLEAEADEIRHEQQEIIEEGLHGDGLTWFAPETVEEPDEDEEEDDPDDEDFEDDEDESTDE